MSIKVWGRATCPPCRGVKHWLKTKQIEYQEIDVDSNLDEFRKLGYATVPVIEVDGRYFNNLPALANHLNNLL